MRFCREESKVRPLLKYMVNFDLVRHNLLTHYVLQLNLHERMEEDKGRLFILTLKTPSDLNEFWRSLKDSMLTEVRF